LYFLTNKYQQEYVAHGNKARVITKVGTATLMTNLTAAGFATFIITNSELLKEFGIISSLSIVALLFMSYYHSHLLQLSTLPQEKHLRHLSRNYTKVFMA
jgi:predicted RND superfamily exporter protein